jgi:hypothetical protein
MIMKKTSKAKEIRVTAKARALKEMFVGGGIDQHDLGIKMKKVISFLQDGHPVKVSVTALKRRLKIDPFCVEETTLKVLELVEDFVLSVQQADSFSNMRKDFTLNPKPRIDAPKTKGSKKDRSKAASAVIEEKTQILQERAKELLEAEKEEEEERALAEGDVLEEGTEGGDGEDVEEKGEGEEGEEEESAGDGEEEGEGEEEEEEEKEEEEEEQQIVRSGRKDKNKKSIGNFDPDE